MTRPRAWSSRALLACAGVALFFVGLIAGVHRESPRTAISAHGLLHTAIANRFLDGWPRRLPPENPLFAGEPLPYYWFFHALGAAVARVADVPAVVGFEWWILLATALVPFACGSLTRRLWGSAGLGALATWLVLVGGHPQSPLVFLWRRLRWGPEIYADNPYYLWGLAHPILGTTRIGDPNAVYGPLLPFFLNTTSRPLALAAWIAALAAGVRLLEEGRLRHALGLAAAVALCVAFSVVLALPALAALGAGVGALAALRAWRGGRPGRLDWPPFSGRAAAATAVGTALGLTTCWHLFTGGAGGGVTILAGGLGQVVERSTALAACAWLPGLLALGALRRAAPATRDLAVVLGVAAALLCAGAIVVDLPAGNHVNLFHTAFVLIALGATGATVGLAGRPVPWRVAALVAVFVPTLAITLLAYTRRPPIPVRFAGTALERVPADSDEARLYAWIRLHTAPDAVFVISPHDPIRAFMGNTAELPAFTARTLWTDRSHHYLVSPSKDAPRRSAIADALLAGRTLSAEDAAYVRALDRPLYLVVDPPLGPGAREAVAAASGPPVFESGGTALFRWPGAAPAGPR